MPIYAYRCTSCGHAKDVLQKISDPALTVCPACGAATFAKQLTAAGFQLKGSGWYATDFKGGGSKPSEGNKSSESSTDTKAETKTETKAETAKPDSGKSGSDSGAVSKPAAAGR